MDKNENRPRGVFEAQLASRVVDESERMNVPPLPLAKIERTIRSHRRRRAFVGGVAALATVGAASVVYSMTLAPTNHADQQVASQQPNTLSDSPAVVPPGPVVATTSIDAALKDSFPRIQDMFGADKVDAIVEGEIKAVDYFTVDGDLPMTRIVVSVTSVLQGRSDETVTLWEDGGFVSQGDMYRANSDKFPDSTPPKDEEAFVDVRFEGADHPAVGQEVLLFLMEYTVPLPVELQELGGATPYSALGSVFGRFTLRADDIYERPGVGDPSWETEISQEDARRATGGR